MSAYRSPSAPAESSQFIELPPHRGRRVVLAFCLWFMGFWFIVFPVAWFVQAIVTGEALWKLAVSPLLWLIVPWGITRTMKMETLVLGTQTIRRIGFLRDHVKEWSSIETVRTFERQRSRGRPVRLYGLQGKGGELVIAPDVVEDRANVLSWALQTATRGNVTEIDERVRSEGATLNRMRWYVPHLVTGLILSVLSGWFIGIDQRRHVVRRELAALSNLPSAERFERATALLEDEGEDPQIRCRAAGILTSTQVHHGELERAIETCRREEGLACLVPPDCDRFVRLRDARDALAAGEPERALGLVENTGAGVVRDAIEVSALRALGRDFGEQAARCWDIYGDSEDARVRELAAPCAIDNGSAPR